MFEELDRACDTQATEQEAAWLDGMPHVSTQEPSSRPFRPRSSIMPWELNKRHGPNTARSAKEIQYLNRSSRSLQAPWSWVLSCPVLALQRVSSQCPAWQGTTNDHGQNNNKVAARGRNAKMSKSLTTHHSGCRGVPRWHTEGIQATARSTNSLIWLGIHHGPWPKKKSLPKPTFWDMHVFLDW